MEKDKLNIYWKQEGNKVYFDFNGTEIFFIMPEDFKLENTHPDLLKLAEHFMFSPWFNVLDGYKFSRVGGKDIGLAFSTGVDSTAVHLLYPEAKLVYLERDGIEQGLLNQENAFRMINNMEDSVLIIKSNIEVIRTKFGLPAGYPTNLGMGVPVMLLADYLNLGILSYGKVLDDQFFLKGCFENYSEEYLKDQDILFSAGLLGFYPVVGCSEVITTEMVDNSKYKEFSFSCIRGKEGKGCNNCYKCFRKNMLRGEEYKVNEETNTFTKKDIPKMATSLLYAFKKRKEDLSLLDLEYLNDLDVKMLNKVYPEAYYIYPKEMQEDLFNRLNKCGYDCMTKEEEGVLKKLNFCRKKE